MKAYGGVNVYVHVFLTSVLVGLSGTGKKYWNGACVGTWWCICNALLAFRLQGLESKICRVQSFSHILLSPTPRPNQTKFKNCEVYCDSGLTPSYRSSLLSAIILSGEKCEGFARHSHCILLSTKRWENTSHVWFLWFHPPDMGRVS
jgi:hypothetical protein